LASSTRPNIYNFRNSEKVGFIFYAVCKRLKNYGRKYERETEREGKKNRKEVKSKIKVQW
jgi:hypothetical protein